VHQRVAAFLNGIGLLVTLAELSPELPH